MEDGTYALRDGEAVVVLVYAFGGCSLEARGGLREMQSQARSIHAGWLRGKRLLASWLDGWREGIHDDLLT